MKKQYLALKDNLATVNNMDQKSVKAVRVCYNSPDGLTLFKHVQEYLSNICVFLRCFFIF